jgi:hypothetical protein
VDIDVAQIRKAGSLLEEQVNQYPQPDPVSIPSRPESSPVLAAQGETVGKRFDRSLS